MTPSPLPERARRALRKGSSDEPILPRNKRGEGAEARQQSEKRGRDLSAGGDNAIPGTTPHEAKPSNDKDRAVPEATHTHAPEPDTATPTTPEEIRGAPEGSADSPRRHRGAKPEREGSRLLATFAVAFVLVAVACGVAWQLFLREAGEVHDQAFVPVELSDVPELVNRPKPVPLKVSSVEQMLLKHHNASGMNKHTAYSSEWTQRFADGTESIFLEDRMFMDSLRQVSLRGSDYTALVCTSDNLSTWTGSGAETETPEVMDAYAFTAKHVSDIDMYRPLITYRKHPDRFSMVDDVTVNGVVGKTVRYTPPDGPEVDMVFDPETGHELSRIIYHTTDKGTYTRRTDFQDYRNVGGVPIAHKRLQYRDGELLEELVLESYKPNPDFPLTHFIAGRAEPRAVSGRD